MCRANAFICAVLIIATWRSPARAAEIWNYQFTPTDSRPYEYTCSCTPEYDARRADVSGTFSILLDWQTATGKLLALNETLVNPVQFSGTTQTPILNNPFYRILPTAVAEMFGDGQFTYANNLGHLTSNGQIRLPNNQVTSGIPYDIWFTPTAATFNLAVPIDDFYISVSGAFAAYDSYSIAGDLNGDFLVDTRDYIVWRKTGGSQTNFDLWRKYYNPGPLFMTFNGAPEPSAILLFIVAMTCLAGRRSR
jgi:hypothetical protein